MSKGMWFAALCGLCLAGPAMAQSSLFGGVDPTKLIFQPVDTSASLVPIASPQTLPSTGFSLSSLMPSFSLPMGKPIFGSSSFPTQGQMPTTQNYLKYFGYQRTSFKAP